MGQIPKNATASVRKLNPHLYDCGPAPVSFSDKITAQLHNPSTGTNLGFKPSSDEDKLNKTEKAWLCQLRLLYPAYHIGIQSITLKLGDDCRYTPDFWTIDANGQLFFWETKGFFRDDAKVKIKVAARLFRWARFVVVTRAKGVWTETPVSP